jgi:hypothetical protein
LLPVWQSLTLGNDLNKFGKNLERETTHNLNSKPSRFREFIYLTSLHIKHTHSESISKTMLIKFLLKFDQNENNIMGINYTFKDGCQIITYD